MPVGGIDRVSRADDEQQHHGHFNKHNNVVDRRGFTNANHQQERDDSNNDDRRQIKDGRDLCSIRERDKRPACRGQFRRDVNADVAQKRDDVARPADRNRNRSQSVFEDQIPADDPCEQLPERGVAVGVGAAGHRYKRCELAVAERREDRGDPREHER